MNGLALCSGYGGIELGLRIVFGDDYRTVCYVERDLVAASVLAERMEDGSLEPAPIWSDVDTFDGSAWCGRVDVVTAGFPCQPWSVAGKRLGFDDERWIWPSIARIIREVGPELVFLENVPGLVRAGLGAVLGDLAEAGFDAEWDCFAAAEAGAPHWRWRLFVLGYAQSGGYRWRGVADENARMGFAGPGEGVYPPGPRGEWARWDGAEPCVHRDPDGTADRLDRSFLLGNGVVPDVAALAFRTLAGRIGA